MPEEKKEEIVSDHIHEWEFSYTYSDWWDGDEEDIYECIVKDCRELKYVYAPR